MKFVRAHANGFIALGLFVATFFTLFLNGPNVGFTRDEGYYFSASEHYAGWFRQAGKNPSQAFSEPGIRRHFEVNREHPVLVKNLMALCHLAFQPEQARWNAKEGFKGLGSYSRVMRLPAHLIAALGVALLILKSAIELAVELGVRRVAFSSSMGIPRSKATQVTAR